MGPAWSRIYTSPPLPAVQRHCASKASRRDRFTSPAIRWWTHSGPSPVAAARSRPAISYSSPPTDERTSANRYEGCCVRSGGWLFDSPTPVSSIRCTRIRTSARGQFPPGRPQRRSGPAGRLRAARLLAPLLPPRHQRQRWNPGGSSLLRQAGPVASRAALVRSASSGAHPPLDGDRAPREPSRGRKRPVRSR